MPKRGRPAREPTEAEREKVKELAASEAPVADIAKLLQRSIPNLRKYFSKELETGKKRAAKKGALPFEITKAVREKVARYIGCKMKPEDVARVIGVTIGQLEEHFADEIRVGVAVTRAKVIDHLHDQMEEGLVGATNRLESMTAIAPDAEGGQASGAHSGGKKVVAKAVAVAAVAGGSKFAPRPAPRLAVDNTGS